MNNKCINLLRHKCKFLMNEYEFKFNRIPVEQCLFYRNYYSYQFIPQDILKTPGRQKKLIKHCLYENHTIRELHWLSEYRMLFLPYVEHVQIILFTILRHPRRWHWRCQIQFRRRSHWSIFHLPIPKDPRRRLQIRLGWRIRRISRFAICYHQ